MVTYNIVSTHESIERRNTAENNQHARQMETYLSIEQGDHKTDACNVTRQDRNIEKKREVKQERFLHYKQKIEPLAQINETLEWHPKIEE